MLVTRLWPEQGQNRIVDASFRQGLRLRALQRDMAATPHCHAGGENTGGDQRQQCHAPEHGDQGKAPSRVMSQPWPKDLHRP